MKERTIDAGAIGGPPQSSVAEADKLRDRRIEVARRSWTELRETDLVPQLTVGRDLPYLPKPRAGEVTRRAAPEPPGEVIYHPPGATLIRPVGQVLVGGGLSPPGAS